MNLDVSVAPEIAQLIDPRPRAHGSAPAPGAATGPGSAGTGASADGSDPAGAQPPTVGRLARELRVITAAPGRWWGLVRFDPARPLRVAIPAPPWYEAWLVIMPPSDRRGRPGHAGHAGDGGRTGDGGECGCEVVTVVAGEVTEQAIGAPAHAAREPAATPLLPGRVRVHGAGQPHRVVNLGGSYAVTLHARGR